MQVENGTTSDAVAALFDERLTGTAKVQRAIYIRAGDTTTVRQIAPGTYVLRFSLGLDWDETALRFRYGQTYSEFVSPLQYSETREGNETVYTQHEVTLHPVPHGNAQTKSIDAALFDLSTPNRIRKSPKAIGARIDASLNQIEPPARPSQVDRPTEYDWTGVLDETARVKTAQEIAKQASRSTVLLVTEDASGQLLSFGTGFIVGAGKVATNLHVIEGAARGYVKPVSQATKAEIDGVLAMDAQRDLAILSVRLPSGVALLLGDSDATEVGEDVYAIGNPEGLEGTFSAGVVSAIRNIGGDRLIQITAAISLGSSGGPVLNDRAEVIGVSVATFLEGQNLNFAIPANYLRPLLATTASAIPLARASTPKARPSVLPDSGERAPQGVGVGQVRWGGSTTSDWRSQSLEFSIFNDLKQDVKNVVYRVVFRDRQGDVVDVFDGGYGGVIPAGLAKRNSIPVSYSIQRLLPTESVYGVPPEEVERWERDVKAGRASWADAPRGPIAIGKGIEFRILSFSVVR